METNTDGMRGNIPQNDRGQTEGRSPEERDEGAFAPEEQKTFFPRRNEEGSFSAEGEEFSLARDPLIYAEEIGYRDGPDADPFAPASGERAPFGASGKKPLSERSFRERIAAAAEFAKLFEGEEKTSSLLKKRDLFGADPRRLYAPAEYGAEGKEREYVLAALIFYLLSGGKYAQDVWKDVLKPGAETDYQIVRASFKTLASTLRPILSGVEKELSPFSKETVTALKRNDVALALAEADMDGTETGGCKLFELLWEVLVTKYGLYSAAFWGKTLSESAQMTHICRCHSELVREDVELFSVSYQGRLEKPSHPTCQDYSECVFFDDALLGDAFLAVSADGVGSSVHSAVGSELAVKALIAALYDLLPAETETHARFKRLPNRRAPVFLRADGNGESVYGSFMENLRFGLASKLYEGWRKRVEEVGGADADDAAYCTTLQFVFGCRRFLACGAVGDGVFAVKKHEKIGDGEIAGIFRPGDGISGVTRSNVLGVPHLRTNPDALQIFFFDPAEVDSVLIASDGADALFDLPPEELVRKMEELERLGARERGERLDRLARIGADCNETNYGCGDDCSIAFVRLKD